MKTLTPIGKYEFRKNRSQSDFSEKFRKSAVPRIFGHFDETDGQNEWKNRFPLNFLMFFAKKIIEIEAKLRFLEGFKEFFAPTPKS